MEVKKISVSAGRTFNHPYEQYSNLRFDIKIEAEIREGGDYMQCVQALQHEAETRAEEHKAALLKDIHLLEEAARVSSKVSDLERRIKEANQDLERMKEWQKNHTANANLMLNHETISEEDESIRF